MPQRQTDQMRTYLVDLPVTVSAMVLSRLGGRISSLRTFDSVANGNPLSSISSKSWKQSSRMNYVASATLIGNLQKCSPMHNWRSRHVSRTQIHFVKYNSFQKQ